MASKFYARYVSRNYISKWKIYKKRFLWFKEEIAEFEVYNGSDCPLDVYRQKVTEFIKILKEEEKEC